MNTHKHSPLWAVVLLAISFALAGCGGGSNSSGSPAPPDPQEERITQLEGELKEANDELTELRNEDQMEEDDNMNAMAKKLFAALGGTGALVVTAGDVGGARYGPTQAEKAVKGTYMNHATREFMDTNSDGQVIHVLQYDNKGTDGTQPLTDDVEASVLATNATSIMASVFASSGQPKMHKTNDQGIFSTRGTYNGAPGQYRCDASSTGSCSSRAASGGGIQLGGGGTWVFDPDPGAMQAMPDTKYATFGWWLDEVVTAANTKKVRAFAHLPDGAASGSVSGVTGNATYKGIAVGKAAVYSPIGVSNVAGAFTANAELTVDFDGTAMIEGTITDFKVGDHSPAWSVALNSADVSSGAASLSTVGTVWTIDGVEADAAGSWSATLYDKGADVGGFAAQPMGVTGGFESAHGTVGRMVGAFGAEQEKK